MSEPPPDGFRWINGGPAMELIDPDPCPGGHPLTGQRGWTPCYQHRGHKTWMCGCGLTLYRVPGAFVTELSCR